MSRTNEALGRVFEEIADLLDLRGEDRFRVLSYRRAADVVRGLATDVSTLKEAELRDVRGIGASTARKIREYVDTGTLATLEELRADVPSGLRAITGLAGMGPKRAMLLHRELGVSTIEDLEEAVREQRVRTVKGFGPKFEENIARALAGRRPTDDGEPERRILLSRALATAEELIAALTDEPAVLRCAYAGSLRRWRETIGDLDLLVAGEEPQDVMDAFRSLPQVVRVLASGETKTSILSSEGLQVDLRVVAPDAFGAALQYFTGSKEHNVKVRERAVKLGMKLSEYGLFRTDTEERIASETEAEVYEALGMPWIAPALREDRGEVEAALAGELPDLVEHEHIRGDLHGHSTYSDGRADLRKMVLAAAELGYEYYALTDHGKNIGAVRGLSEADIQKQRDEIRKLNQELDGRITVLHGLEANVAPDGSLDYPDEILAGFDVVVASVHSQLSRDATERILKAVANPHVHILGHPTGRRITSRPPMEFDLDAVAQACARHGVALEVNSNPERLDLRDEHVRHARTHGVRFVVSTDAHGPEQLGNMRLGVGTAQRGWAERDAVINTWPLRRLRRFLAK